MGRKLNAGSIVVIVLGVLTLIFTALVIAKGKNGPIGAFLGLASFALFIAVILTLIVGVRGSLYDKAALRNSVIGLVVMIVLFFVGKMVFQKSDIPELYVQKGMATQADWDNISGGLFLTYILITISVLLMIASFARGIFKTNSQTAVESNTE